MGALLDPVVDRLTVLAGPTVCWHFELLPRWALALLAVRELVTLVLAQLALRRGIDIEVNWIGRIGVFLVFGGIFWSMVSTGGSSRPGSCSGSRSRPRNRRLRPGRARSRAGRRVRMGLHRRKLEQTLKLNLEVCRSVVYSALTESTDRRILGAKMRTEYDDTFPDIGKLGDDELKSLISELADEEREVSYRRRVLHGKIDILRAELVNRLKVKREEGDATITGADVQQLTDILLGKVRGARRPGPRGARPDGAPLSGVRLRQPRGSQLLSEVRRLPRAPGGAATSRRR